MRGGGGVRRFCGRFWNERYWGRNFGLKRKRKLEGAVVGGGRPGETEKGEKGSGKWKNERGGETNRKD